jgi:hypothetical protein
VGTETQLYKAHRKTQSQKRVRNTRYPQEQQQKTNEVAHKPEQFAALDSTPPDKQRRLFVSAFTRSKQEKGTAAISIRSLSRQGKGKRQQTTEMPT